ncbi:MAG: hypothetical protein ACXWC1_14295, partial [Burkholderiales bacterium]
LRLRLPFVSSVLPLLAAAPLEPPLVPAVLVLPEPPAALLVLEPPLVAPEGAPVPVLLEPALLDGSDAPCCPAAVPGPLRPALSVSVAD